MPGENWDARKEDKAMNRFLTTSLGILIGALLAVLIIYMKTKTLDVSTFLGVLTGAAMVSIIVFFSNRRKRKNNQP